MPVALLTGASRGFGYATAEALAAQGWDLIVDARDAAALDRAVVELRSRAAAGAQILAVPGDVTDLSHQATLARVVRTVGPLDLLINNASTLGTSPLPTLEHYQQAALAKVFEVNVLAPLALIQRFAEELGVVVNLSSDAAVEAYEGWGGYGASKAALDQLTAVLAAERPDLRVYAFDPGDMRTDMHQNAFPGEDISDRPLPATVVPALLRLLTERPSSGRYRATELLAGVDA
jgi:NAD(P)-dependent dehydrogenase (short-subunit alcohol dehydrogenase family)